jgi:iron complex transport system substrate-binding protein
MKKIISLILCLTLSLALAACGTGSPSDSNQPNGETRKFVDSAGREVDIPINIERIIPSGQLAQSFMWPLAADKLISLNAEMTPEQLKYYGDKFANLPVTGNLYQTGSELNIEEVASLGAQIIIDFGEPKDTIVEDLDNLQSLLDIPCIFIEGSFTNTADAYRTLGELLNMKSEAEEIAVYVENIMKKASDVFAKTEKKTLAFLNSEDGLGCIARGTFFDEIWSYIGTNVAEVNDAQMYWFSTVTLEQMLIWDPEYLYFYSQNAYNTAITDPTWGELTAVKEGHCYTIPQYPLDFCLSPSVNRYMGIIWLATIMYPDEFGWNLKEEVTKYYDMFYHYKMDDTTYNELMGIK